jgi:Acyl-CoA reductase (LuxC)
VQPPSLPQPAFMRAFPARIAHIMAGNTPTVAATTITRAALTKGVHLLKLPSNDPLTAPAILRTMADLSPGHPVVASFSAALWQGGDRSVEDVLFRAQFFDKLIAWGGESAIRNALSYAAPGFQVITFDPKVSVSLIGREAFASNSVLKKVAERGATDVSIINQDVCASAVFQFVEGSTKEIDAYCELLAAELAVDRRWSDGLASPLPEELRENIRGLMGFDELYRVFGDFDGHGAVIRSSDPVEFHPSGKVVNVVQVNELADALKWMTVATQTVGMYPAQRRTELRDRLASRGVQRLVELGDAWNLPPGLSHDGHFPLQHMIRWIVDQN